MVHGATSMGLLRIEDRVFIGCVVAEWARSENTTFLGPLLQFSEFRVQSRSHVIYVLCHSIFVFELLTSKRIALPAEVASHQLPELPQR